MGTPDIAAHSHAAFISRQKADDDNTEQNIERRGNAPFEKTSR
jgi:hypothetical protein